MNNNNLKPKVLYLDDDEENLIGFETSFEKDFNILVANSVKEAEKILKSITITVFLVDIKMPEEDGISFVKRIQGEFPDTIFILVTAHADLETAVSAINCNLFYHFVHKPWNYFELKTLIYNAIEKYNLRIEKKELLINLEVALEKEKNANQLKNIFLNTISHEIRTPANGILGFAELAKKRTSDEQLIDYLDIISESGNQLIYIIQEVIDSSIIVSNLLNYKEEAFLLSSIVDEIITEQIMKHNKTPEIKIINNIPKDLTLVNDKNKIQKAISCLIDNALIYSCLGEVTINLQNAQNNTEFTLCVCNSGSYIPDDMRNLIFEPFRQIDSTLSRKFGGNGLGLFIAKSYIEFLGGKIWVESDVSNYTTFSFTFTNKK